MDSPATIVARFLKANHYNDTLEAFLNEAGLPTDAGSSTPNDLSLETILKEKEAFDLVLNLEKVAVGDEDGEWSLPAPSIPNQIFSLPSSANILFVTINRFRDEVAPHPDQLLFATTADRQLHSFALDETFPLYKSLSHLQNSPILSCVPVPAKHLTTVTSGMFGSTLLYDHGQGRVLDHRQDHTKYIVNVAIYEEISCIWIATAGWDAKIFLYKINRERDIKLGRPVASITTATNPESVAFIKHPDLDRPILLVSRRDSTSLHYYCVPAADDSSFQGATTAQLDLLGSQSLTPHSTAWIAFSPSSIALCPTDPTLVAVATSTIPHMKLIIVRLLIPSLTLLPVATNSHAAQTAQNLANLAIQDREEAAIVTNVNTLAPQTPYSTPKVVWRPDGTGLWVNGDDGILRGLETRTGKVVATLINGHEVGSKIRSIWCGQVEVGGKQEEWVVSGGFDRRLIVWKP